VSAFTAHFFGALALIHRFNIVRAEYLERELMALTTQAGARCSLPRFVRKASLRELQKTSRAATLLFYCHLSWRGTKAPLAMAIDATQSQRLHCSND
jgi:hypothetical protein